MAQPRSAERWRALSAGNRRRWRAAFGSEDAARTAYIRGASLTRAQRGHLLTPSSPGEALRAPWKYPGYVARHTDELNELARRRGLREHGTGPRGNRVEASDIPPGDEFTWVVPEGTLDLRDARFSAVFRTRRAAQLYARKSWAPAGIVIIVDRGPGVRWRYEVWFTYPESRLKGYKGFGGRMRPPGQTQRENIERLRNEGNFQNSS